MKPVIEQVLLRVQLSNFVRWHTGPLYEALVERAYRERLSGATVLSGAYGYVDRGPLIGDHPNALQVERPVVVEFVDEEDRLMHFLETVMPMLSGHAAIVTLERAGVVHYGGREEGR